MAGVGNKFTQAFWRCSVTEKAVSKDNGKPKVDLYFLSWDETGKCVGRQNITWKTNISVRSSTTFSKP